MLIYCCFLKQLHSTIIISVRKRVVLRAGWRQREKNSSEWLRETPHQQQFGVNTEAMIFPNAMCPEAASHEKAEHTPWNKIKNPIQCCRKRARHRGTDYV